MLLEDLRDHRQAHRREERSSEDLQDHRHFRLREGDSSEDLRSRRQVPHLMEHPSLGYGEARHI